MGFDLFIPESSYTVEGGQRFKVMASNINATNKKEQTIIFSQPEGHVDDRGVFTAPDVKNSQTFLVNVFCAGDTSQSDVVQVTVNPKPTKDDKIPSYMELRTPGKKGEYNLVIQVTDQKKAGIKSEIIIVDYESDPAKALIPPSIGTPINGEPNQIKVMTDEKGFLAIKLNPFFEKRRHLLIRVSGNLLDERRLSLKGPERKREHIQYDTGKSWIQNLKDNYY